MKIFLVCNEEGYGINVVSATTFEEAYKNTIGLNNGEMLVEIDEHVLKKIEDIKKQVDSKKERFLII